MARVSEFGRKWDARVPRADISWLMGRFHVGATAAEIEADIRRRCTGRPGYTDSIIRQSVEYALICHERNRGLFSRVMGGR